MSKQPMSLEDLPKYLKSQRESGNAGSAPIVQMGHIESKNKSFMKWVQRVGLTMAMMMTLGVGVLSYDTMSTNNITVIVDTDSPQSITKIVSDGGGQVLSVTHKENSIYEVEVKTKKSRNSFLNWLRGNKGVKDVVLEDRL